MSFWKKVTGQFIDVIEWTDTTSNTMVWKFPRYDNEIKNGAQLIVRESQAAVFLHEGELGDVFGPGRVQLSTNNIPILTTLKSWKYAFDAPFKCDVYFVNTKQFTDQKWGTQNPLMLRDPEFGPIRLRGFGTYAFRVTDPGAFIRQIAGTNPLFETDDISSQLRNILVSRFANALGECKLAALDLVSNYNELGAKLTDFMQPEFAEYGLTLTKFLVENISLPEEVEKALDARSKMGILGNLNAYTQMKTADAIGDMANNPGTGGGMMGMIGGMNMGGVMAGAMNAGQQQMHPQQPAAPAAPAAGAAPPPLPAQVAYFAAIGGQQVGPLGMDALRQRAAQGEVSRETLVWAQGMANWTAAGQVPELAGLFTAPPPMPPPPMPQG